MKRKTIYLVGLVIALMLVISVSAVTQNYTLTYPQQITIVNNSENNYPENGAISITFDDGWENVYTVAMPMMEQYGYVGTFYVISDWVEQTGKVTAQQLLDMQNRGWEIGSHSVSHQLFTTLSETEIRYECSESKAILEGYGLNVTNFAYPGGYTNEAIDSIVSEYYMSYRYAWDKFGQGYVLQFPIEDGGLSAYALTRVLSVDLGVHTIESKVDAVYNSGGYSIFFFHKIDGNYVALFEDFLAYVHQKGIAVMTVEQALNLGENPAPEANVNIEVYENPLGQPLENGTLMNWGEGHIGNNSKNLWVKNTGVATINLQLDCEILPENWQLSWDYNGSVLEVGDTLETVLILTVTESDEGTYSFGPLYVIGEGIAN